MDRMIQETLLEEVPLRGKIQEVDSTELVHCMFVASLRLWQTLGYLPRSFLRVVDGSFGIIKIKLSKFAHDNLGVAQEGSHYLLVGWFVKSNYIFLMHSLLNL